MSYNESHSNLHLKTQRVMNYIAITNNECKWFPMISFYPVTLQLSDCFISTNYMNVSLDCCYVSNLLQTNEIKLQQTYKKQLLHPNKILPLLYQLLLTQSYTKSIFKILQQIETRFCTPFCKQQINVSISWMSQHLILNITRCLKQFLVHRRKQWKKVKKKEMPMMRKQNKDVTIVVRISDLHCAFWSNLFICCAHVMLRCSRWL